MDKTCAWCKHFCRDAFSGGETWAQCDVIGVVVWGPDNCRYFAPVAGWSEDSGHYCMSVTD